MFSTDAIAAKTGSPHRLYVYASAFEFIIIYTFASLLYASNNTFRIWKRDGKRRYMCCRLPCINALHTQSQEYIINCGRASALSLPPVEPMGQILYKRTACHRSMQFAAKVRSRSLVVDAGVHKCERRDFFAGCPPTTMPQSPFYWSAAFFHQFRNTLSLLWAWAIKLPLNGWLVFGCELKWKIMAVARTNINRDGSFFRIKVQTPQCQRRLFLWFRSKLCLPEANAFCLLHPNTYENAAALISFWCCVQNRQRSSFENNAECSSFRRQSLFTAAANRRLTCIALSVCVYTSRRCQ